MRGLVVIKPWLTVRSSGCSIPSCYYGVTEDAQPKYFPPFFMGQLTENGSLRCCAAFQSQLYETSCCSGLHVHRGLIQAGRKRFCCEQRFPNVHPCLLCLMVTLFDKHNHFGLSMNLTDLGHCLPKFSQPFSSPGRVGDVLKWLALAAITPSQGEALKGLWRSVSLSEETSCHFFFISLFLAQRKWK